MIRDYKRRRPSRQTDKKHYPSLDRRAHSACPLVSVILKGGPNYSYTFGTKLHNWHLSETEGFRTGRYKVARSKKKANYNG
jgi:hypothetical protein